MSDETPPTGGNPGTPPEPSKTFTQDDLNALDAKLKREYKARESELKKKADQWDQYEQSKKTEEQKASERAAALEKERDALKASIELDKARRKYGRKYHIPEADWDRLRGSTAEEVDADAKEWAKARGLDRTGGPTPSGASANPNPNQGFNEFVLRGAGRGGR